MQSGGPETRPVTLHAAWWLILPIVVALACVVTAMLWPAFYEHYIEDEGAPLELSHFVIPLLAFAVSLRCLALPAVRRSPLLLAWAAIAALGSLYIAGEEVSWGQQFVFWETPEAWRGINDQQETNLHNVSSWLDQKPRTLLEIGVIVGGILIPLAALARPSIRRHRLAVLFPPLALLPTALLAELLRLPERLDKALGTSLQVFPRGSEVQELYFYWFVLLYMVLLHRHLAAREQG